MSADYTRNVSSSSSNNMHHVSSSSNKGGRPVSILPNMSIQNMSNWSLMNMNMANMANMTNMSNMSYPMMRPSVMVKQRKTNFTQREVDALINSVRQHQDTVLFGVAGGPGWAKAWTQVAAAVSGVEGIVRSEGDVRKKWTYLKWEAKNTSKPDRDSTSRAVLQILTSRQNQIDAANHHAAATLRGDMRINDARDSLRDAVQSSRSLLEELLVPPQPGVIAPDGSPQPQPSASVGRPPAQPKQVDVKREPMAAASPRERPSPSSHPQPAMPQSAGHPASMSTPPGHPAGLPAGHPASSVHAQQLPPPRRSAPAPMRPPSPVLPPQAAAPPPEVCLRWNSYHSNMQATFPSLLNNEQFVDVTLACEGHSIKCHKVMLSACSSYFEELLSQNPCQHPIVLMKDLRFWEVQALVDFMYRGEVNVTQDKLPSLLAAAEALQIKGLAGPATNSHDGDSQRGFEERRRKRQRTMPDAELPRNPVGRPRIHPKPPQQRQSGPAAPAQSSMPPRINVRPEQLLQRPIQMDEGPPAQRMKHSPPASPPVKMEPLETDLSNDSLDKLRYDAESGGSGDGSNHGDALVDLSQARYSINNGLQPDRNRDRDHSDNEHDEDRDRHLDDEEDRDVEGHRGQENERNQLRDHHDIDQDNDQEEDHDMDHDMNQDMNQERDDQGLTMGGGSEDDQDSHSSDEDQYDNEPPQDSRQQSDLLPDHLLGRL
ncbi:protein jim lovell-like isoform X3 [Thrips palmi]|uniref:Regulatory protein zeste n=1 Tax=Thrips palmi TaxID=161013 RepID=A0A6P8ZIQ7_THRPL|nr:protein jim lovell-like isoform X3 [Thrips palmi]